MDWTTECLAFAEPEFRSQWSWTISPQGNLGSILDKYPTLQLEHIPAEIASAADLARERMVPIST